MDNSSDQRSKRPAKRGAGIVMALATIGVLGGAGLFLGSLELDPHVAIPAPPPPPSPNAFDDYAKAQSLLTDQKLFEGPQAPGTTTAGALTQAVQNQVLRDNAPALRALRLGLTHEYAAPPLRSFNATCKYLAHDREIARFLAFERDVQSARGEWRAAMQTTLDGLQMGTDMHHGDGLGGMLTGVAVDSISRDPSHHVIDHLGSAETKAALSRIQRINARRVPLARTFQEDEWNCQASLMALFHQPNWRSRLTGGSTNGASWPTRLPIALTSRRRVMSEYTQYMDTMIDDERARRPLTPIVPSISNPLLGFPIEDLRDAEIRYNVDLTQNDFLELQLALRAYKLQLGTYPETLRALSPAFEPIIPDDPFALGQPLRYQKLGESYILYSIGPDRVDDGGKAIYDAQATSVLERPNVKIDSKGDIVAGANF